MSGKGGILLLGLAAGGLAWLLSGTASAAEQDVSRRVADALATEDPARMRIAAVALRAEGHHKGATELEQAAADLEADRIAAALPGGVADLVPPAPSLPPLVTSPGWPQPEPSARQEEPHHATSTASIPGPVLDAIRAAGLPTRAPPRAAPAPLPAPAADDGTPPEFQPEPTRPAPAAPSAFQVLSAIGDPVPGGPTLRRGSKGANVTAWQRVLLSLDSGALPEFGADGGFGGETEKATRRLQGAANALYDSVGLAPLLEVDGVVGPMTRTGAARLLAYRTELVS